MMLFGAAQIGFTQLAMGMPLVSLCNQKGYVSMSELTSKDVEKASQQDEDTRRAVLESQAATAGDASAVGQALADLDGVEEERLKGHPRGAKEEPLGAPSSGDFGEGARDKPTGLQAVPAAWGPNGSIPAGMVSSPSGHQPVGAVGATAEALEVTYGRQPTGDLNSLDERTVNGLSGPELRAIGQQRGYEMPDSGSRSARRAFLEAQAADTRFTKAGSSKAAKKSA